MFCNPEKEEPLAHRIFVTATNTDIGKTYTTMQLLRHYAKAGYRVGAFKPIETGVTALPPDGSALLKLVQELNPEFSDMEVDDIVPIQLELPAAPYVANRAAPIDLDRIDKTLSHVEERCDIVIIEGAGGLLVPLDKNLDILGLIRHFRARALLVSHCRLGCINDTLLNLMALEQAAVPCEWILNCRESDTSFETVSAPYLNDRFGSFFRLRENLDLLAAALLDQGHL
jgi:dethiobiotin synthetase